MPAGKCTICQTAIDKPRRGPAPAYCSSACRQLAYRRRSELKTRNEIALQVSPESGVKITNPPVRYTGSKWRIASWVIGQFPEHKCYVEPFGGGASVLFCKNPSRQEVINDLNNDVVNFFSVLRTRPDELVQAILLTPFAETEYRDSYATGSITDALERARLFYVRSKMSFGSGEARWVTGWRYQKSDKRGKSITQEWSQVDHLYAAARRLKSVQIACSDYSIILQRFDSPETLFYVDPPYPASTRYENRDYYRHEMLEDAKHIEMAGRLNQVQGMVVLSGYDCPLYADLFAGWRKLEKPARTNGNHEAVECLWISPRCDDARMPLFQSVGADFK
jgi:DNA adenine methylase